MKVVIQNYKSRDFLDENCQWQSNVSKAKKFHSSAEAIIFCIDQNLADAHVVIQFYDSFDVFIPVGISARQEQVA